MLQYRFIFEFIGKHHNFIEKTYSLAILQFPLYIGPS